MQQNDTLNVLISCESQTQLEAFLSLFRETGQVTRAHRVASLRNLGELLRDPQWELLIATDRHPELNPAEALALLAERKSDLPCLVRLADTRGEPALACLRQGAREVVGNDENERLVKAALREVRALRASRELAQLRVQYEEIARRAELLLAASQDAIGYVVDGMHVHANELYASLFGYAGIDELPSVPLVDLIADGRQQEFKDALRLYRAKPEEQTAIDFTGRRADGSEFAGQLVLSTASYEGEPCMQVLIRAAAAAPAAAAPAAGSAPAAGGLAALRDALGAAGARGHLVLLGVDGFVLLCRNHGVTAATRLVGEVGDFLAQSGKWGAGPLRAAEAVLALARPDADTAAALALARAAVEKCAGHIHAVGAQSANCSIVAVVCPLESLATESADTLIDRAWSTLLATAERSAALRGADPARVQLIAPPAAAAPVPAATSAANGSAVGEAVRKGEFRILFQPIVSLRGDSSEYYEVQTVHGDGGKPAAAWLAASKLAEASIDLDKWVVIEAMKKLSAHRVRHPATRLLLPVGTGAVLDAEFGNWFALALRGAEVPAEAVALQLAHPTVASYLRQAKQLAERVQGLGCQVSVGDVHSASNPLADLVHIKPQFARIDAALAQMLRDTDSVNTLIKPLIEALHQEQIASIMPNVEGAGVLSALWQLGVNFIQGDYLQSPQPEMHYEFTDLA